MADLWIPSGNGYSAQLGTGNSTGQSPASATTYYFGMSQGWGNAAAGDTDGQVPCWILVPGTIVAAGISFRYLVAGTGSSSNGTASLRINHASNTANISTAIALTENTNKYEKYTSTTLNTPVAVGDSIIAQFTMPTITSPPTNVFYAAWFYVLVG